MKLLCGCALLITLVAAMQNFRLAQGYPSLTTPRKMCSFKCEVEYFPELINPYKRWASYILPLPTSTNDWNKLCQRRVSFLACSKVQTNDCDESLPPMWRVAQVRDAYGYVCKEGASKFLQVMDCLTENYKENETVSCIKKEAKTTYFDNVCIALESTEMCTTANAMMVCGQTARDFISTFSHETAKYMKKVNDCKSSIEPTTTEMPVKFTPRKL